MKKAWSFIILFVAVSLIVIGAIKGQNQMVLQKAIKICLECVGIG